MAATLYYLFSAEVSKSILSMPDAPCAALPALATLSEWRPMASGRMPCSNGFSDGSRTTLVNSFLNRLHRSRQRAF